jgi:hypothetical protein
VREAVADSTEREFKEKRIQLQIADEEGGQVEVATKHGQIDILTPSKVIELKVAFNWKHAIGQVLVYGLSYPDKEKWVYLFDCEGIYQSEVVRACESFGIYVKFLIN